MTLILGIDPSMRSLGWALGEPGSRPMTGVEELGGAGEREVRVWRNGIVWLSTFLSQHHPEVVAIEAPIMTSAPKDGEKGISNPRTIMVLNGVNAMLRTITFMKTGREASVIYPSSARKALTGKGRFDKGRAKPEVKAACVALGWANQDDPFDVTDALAIWAAAAVHEDQNFAANFTPLVRAS